MITGFDITGIAIEEATASKTETFGVSFTLKIKLVLLFENGKISDIRIPNRVASVEKITKFENEN